MYTLASCCYKSVATLWSPPRPAFFFCLTVLPSGAAPVYVATTAFVFVTSTLAAKLTNALVESQCCLSKLAVIDPIYVFLLENTRYETGSTTQCPQPASARVSRAILDLSAVLIVSKWYLGTYPPPIPRFPRGSNL